MTDTATKVTVKTENDGPQNIASQPWHPLESLHREIDQLFNDFGKGFWRAPFRQLPVGMPFGRSLAIPAVDIAEKDGAYEIKADLPGLDEKNLEVQVVNGNLTIK